MQKKPQNSLRDCIGLQGEQPQCNGEDLQEFSGDRIRHAVRKVALEDFEAKFGIESGVEQ